MLYVNQNKLEHMIKLITHKDVVDTIVKTANPRLFNVYRNDELGYTAIVPKVDGIRPSLCVHTDTVNNIHPTEIEKNNDVWRNADHTKLLGADDRAGCYIIKELITRGMDDYNYLIFDQEEVGGIGSSNYAKTNDGKVVDILTSCYIGLDRLGCMQQALYGYESDEFLDAIEEDYWVNDLGSFTDASNLAGDFNKCCMNLSVGYDSEHTRYETLNVSHMAVTLNRLYNGLNDDLSGTYFIPDEPFDGYPWEDSELDDYYNRTGLHLDRYDPSLDEYKWSDELGAYVMVNQVTGIDQVAENSDDYLTKGA